MGTFKNMAKSAKHLYEPGEDSFDPNISQDYIPPEDMPNTPAPSGDIPSWLQPDDPGFPSGGTGKDPVKSEEEEGPTVGFDEAKPHLIHKTLEDQFISEAFQTAMEPVQVTIGQPGFASGGTPDTMLYRVPHSFGPPENISFDPGDIKFPSYDPTASPYINPDLSLDPNFSLDPNDPRLGPLISSDPASIDPGFKPTISSDFDPASLDPGFNPQISGMYVPPSEDGFRKYIEYQQLSGADSEGMSAEDQQKLTELEGYFGNMLPSTMSVYETAYTDYQNRMEVLHCCEHNKGLYPPADAFTQDYRTPRADNPYGAYMDTVGEMWERADQRVTEIAKSTDSFSMGGDDMELTNEMGQYPQWKHAYSAMREYCEENGVSAIDCSGEAFSEEEVEQISDYMSTYTPEGHERRPTGLATPEFIEVNKDDMVSEKQAADKEAATSEKESAMTDKAAKQYALAQQELNLPEGGDTSIGVAFEMQ